MAILMVSPEGAQAQVSSTEAEYLKTLGWKERSYADFYAKKEVPDFLKPDTLETPSRKRMGRPPREAVIAAEVIDHEYSTDNS